MAAPPVSSRLSQQTRGHTFPPQAMLLGQRPRIRRRQGWGGLGGDPRHEAPYPHLTSMSPSCSQK